ncbi:hypothetical protein [Luteolibacter luteus]|uniref:Uncharacterized protein n=1 Tax=Luteolibacter luteus TaxID=2728835 RepID=A0A858RPW6_9BACT|nr:hypothetical protein [Luteolibacter luteus]QJE98399.1 hypothetical protein HHL09_22290 [Luteolibacter luteus]
MSIWSTFYAGDSTLIESSIRREETRIEGAEEFDLSGGLSCPSFMPEDFAKLLCEGPGGYWDLGQENLLVEAERGLYRMPDSECDRLIAVSGGQIKEFSLKWNEERREQLGKPSRRRELPAFWKIGIGISFGLMAAILPRSSTPGLVILLIWFLCFSALAVFRAKAKRASEIRRAQRRNIDIDWSPQLEGLKDFLKSARQQGLPVYYFWSL